MGKQVNFILLPADVVVLQKEIGAISPFVVLHSRSNSEKVRLLAGLDSRESGEDWLRLFLVRPEDIEDVVTQHVPEQDYWAVDLLRSPVIEFQKCFHDGHELRRGRAYFVEEFYGANRELVRKPPAFCKWAKTVLKTIRGKLLREGPDFVGPIAKSWLEAGGRLIG